MNQLELMYILLALFVGSLVCLFLKSAMQRWKVHLTFIELGLSTSEVALFIYMIATGEGDWWMFLILASLLKNTIKNIYFLVSLKKTG
ncbi:hypothetical protein GCM10008938_07880 [Deinococcus roseus]|uniref:Sodium:proton antiporter n=1 Tax=Deinococcus roseus TaxID=392414 RepID=A0ABQ2CVQ3_9DEIO|nr:hypothetical protein GCM10008938_07880 [Deinococcus roseus]